MKKTKPFGHTFYGDKYFSEYGLAEKPFTWLQEREAIAMHGDKATRMILAAALARRLSGHTQFCVPPEVARMFGFDSRTFNHVLDEMDGLVITVVHRVRDCPHIIQLNHQFERPELYWRDEGPVAKARREYFDGLGPRIRKRLQGM